MPQSPGHTLVIPKVAGENLLDTPETSLAAAIRTTQHVARAVKAAFNASGLVISQFNGATAGQTVFHLHFHIIPVYEGIALQRHARERADTALLEAQASKIREALAAG
jgi:histidine triad (HIT) family protein